MNKDRKHIDDLFREKLSGFELPTSDKDFEAIQLGLKQPKKKRFFLWLIIPALLLSIGASRYLLETFDAPGNRTVHTNPATPEDIGEIPASDASVPEDHELPLPTKPAEFSSTDLNVGSRNASDEKDTAPPAAPVYSDAIQTNEEPWNGLITLAFLKRLDRSIARWPLVGMEIPDQLMEQEQVWNQNPLLPNGRNTRFKPSVELIAGTNLGQQLIPPGESSNPRYREFKQNERTSPGLQLGVQANLSKMRNEFSSGLLYNQYRFHNDNFTILIYDSIPFRNTNGDTIAWIRRNYRDSVYAERQHLSYRAISIPIQYGYNYKIGSNWWLGASIGLRSSFFLPTKGASIDSRGSLRTNSEINIDPIQLNYMLGMQLRYAIDPAISLGFKMQYSGALDSQPNGAIRINDLNFQMNLRYEWYHR
ncbi:MAG: hypothetical protein H6606_06470 [Flavobacteriales bacterium]|nr:hypothetical protein [Flavobacteriales bacterium]